MMNKAELASYLVSLHSLLEAQTKSSHSIASPVLGIEYEKHWGLLKDMIRKENEDEARKSEQQSDGRNEAKDSIRSLRPGDHFNDRG